MCDICNQLQKNENITVVEWIRDIPATKVRAVSRSLVILFLCLFLSDDDGGGDGDGGSD